ncbi:hypothetical protein Aduo_013279 [Ancylostoma duodenale]
MHLLCYYVAVICLCYPLDAILTLRNEVTDAQVTVGTAAPAHATARITRGTVAPANATVGPADKDCPGRAPLRHLCLPCKAFVYSMQTIMEKIILVQKVRKWQQVVS